MAVNAHTHAHALAPISRFVARVWGGGDAKSQPSDCQKETPKVVRAHQDLSPVRTPTILKMQDVSTECLVIKVTPPNGSPQPNVVCKRSPREVVVVVQDEPAIEDDQSDATREEVLLNDCSPKLVPFVEEKINEAPQAAKPKEAQMVHIDKITSIPMDLYWSLMRAGDRAKNSGQHRLKEMRDGRGQLLVGSMEATFDAAQDVTPCGRLHRGKAGSA